jgi:arginine decarboxylase
MVVTGQVGSWSVEDSAALYNVEGWGSSYFSIDPQGHAIVHPGGPGTPSIDLRALIEEVVERGIAAPTLLRFPEILRARLTELNGAFLQAIDEYGYRGTYCGVYPIKVNQERALVDHLVRYGRAYHFGLEAGSKPEFLAAIALLEDPEALVVCNGYKDYEYVETALLSSKLGRKVVLVVEKLSELPLIAEVSRRCKVRPSIGIRSRLSTRGAGRWEASAGDRSKFGLGSPDLLRALAYLRQNGLLDCFELLHFHLGSQVSSIHSVKNGVREATRTYVNLVKMGAPLCFLDVGGGLGVDYDGSRTDGTSSVNYSLREYANDVVYGIQQVCDDEEIPHPNIVSESGRATVAHHAVLVTEVLGVSRFDGSQVPTLPEGEVEAPLLDLFEAHATIDSGQLLEAFHDGTASRDDCLQLYNLGHLSLERWSLAQEAFWALLVRIRDHARRLEEIPDELAGLESFLADTYFCNFSVFQSIPDSWAIEQVFPIMPIQALDEEPTRRAVLADITCDSDGKIDRFINGPGANGVLELHPVGDQPYYIGAFLVGAYQEILGDLHNLFGDTNELIVALDPNGGYRIEEVQVGDTVTDVLGYVGYSRSDLVGRLRQAVERAMRAGAMTREETRELMAVYERSLSGYTYLERP